MLSPYTCIVLNNEMDGFSTPTEISPDMLPPAPADFIRPNKRPLSSMYPTIVPKVNFVIILYSWVALFLLQLIASMTPILSNSKSISAATP